MRKVRFGVLAEDNTVLSKVVECDFKHPPHLEGLPGLGRFRVIASRLVNARVVETRFTGVELDADRTDPMWFETRVILETVNYRGVETFSRCSTWEAAQEEQQTALDYASDLPEIGLDP